MTLVELLIALVLLGISVTGIAAASITASRSSTVANDTARLDVLSGHHILGANKRAHDHGGNTRNEHD